MAQLHVEGGELVLSLSVLEKVGGVHGDLRVPLSAVRAVEVLADAHGPADDVGIKAGTRIPRVIELGTIYGSSKKIFAAVFHNTPRGVRVVLEGAFYDEWIVGAADPETVAQAVQAHLTPGQPDSPGQ
jgi:hypothetical protein